MAPNDSVTRWWFAAPDGTQRFRVATSGRVRASARIDPDGRIYVGSQDDFLYALAPDGTLWASLGWQDDTGIATVPAAGIASFVRVLAEAERELTELGLVAFPSAQQN